MSVVERIMASLCTVQGVSRRSAGSVEPSTFATEEKGSVGNATAIVLDLRSGCEKQRKSTLAFVLSVRKLKKQPMKLSVRAAFIGSV